MQHLITTNDLTIEQIEQILEDAAHFKLQKNPPALLKNKLIFTLFFENSTRTRSSFEVAALRLGAKVVRLDPATSSTKKGESLEDTFLNICALLPDGIVIRHSDNTLAQKFADFNLTPLLNAGSGNLAHPTQALLDLFTLKEHFGNLEGKKVAIVGDIINSRVANSAISLFSRFGIKISLVAPEPFMPRNVNLPKFEQLKDVLDDVDVIMSLRAQLERHNKPIFDDYEKYASLYCLTKENIEERNIIIMHPGPVMRNIDISDDLLSDSRCKVLTQVTNGLFVRMAVLKLLLLDS